MPERSGNEHRTPERQAYVAAVLAIYASLPETPSRARPTDRRLAERWFDDAVPREIVRGALLLGQIRRLMRPPDLPRLTPIRSLYYFVPVVDEVLEKPLSPDYVTYLESKLVAAGKAQAGACSEKRGFR